MNFPFHSCILNKKYVMSQADEIDAATSVTSSDDAAGRIQWHTGFVHAMRLYLKDYEDDIEFNEEFQLTRKPEAMLTAQKEKISDPAKLEELGYDKYTTLSLKSAYRVL